MKKFNKIINKINGLFVEAYRNNNYLVLDLDNENIILNGLKMTSKGVADTEEKKLSIEEKLVS